MALKNVFIKVDRIYAFEKVNLKPREFFNNLRKKKRKLLREMGIADFRVLS